MRIQLARECFHLQQIRFQASRIRPFNSTSIIRQDTLGQSQVERLQWLTSYEAFQRTSSKILPKDWITTSFSRSSGAGGQNVNKVNTKAEVRLDLNAAAKEQAGVPSMPKEVVQYLILNSPYYVASTHSLMITSMKSRTQSGNLEDAMEKLKKHLNSLLSQDIAGETSTEQRSKVKGLIAKDIAKTRISKQRRGAVKKSRKVDRASLEY